ncbi:MAG: DEAD/DEAH box helicase [Deltaproteobacteria bacterium]|nr:DEAD/DEAH box helicase [Deltaproteobacteria bacterium]MCB9785261.1 DEAD/DEAH box helicase [Deltaproteobacteria bacterium]
MAPAFPSEPAEAAVRELLPRTWHAFFGRFGRLTEIQRLAAAPLLTGDDCLLCAPTASGKTEAATAPLLERILASRPASVRFDDPANAPLSLLIVSPTRALANDLLRRLSGPVARARTTLDLKTGDSPEFNDETPPTLLITTPESLDSMLARRPKALCEVRAVLCDELHLLDASARGDQLRCLLARLDRVTAGRSVSPSRVQRAAASATVADPQRLARRTLGDDARVLQAVGARVRAVEVTLRDAERIEDAARAIAEVWLAGEAAKLLVFTNVRAQVEELAALLSATPRMAGHVYAHHGSLARGERLRVERAFLDAPRAVCVATMTLELGIDIGDVDLAVLLAPPPDVSSLLQRAGRANRKGGTNRVMCLHRGAFEAVRFEHLLECASTGRLFDDPIPFRPNVIAQQALSLLFQNPRRSVAPGDVHARLAPDAAAAWSADECGRVLSTMGDQGWLRRVDHGRFVAEPRAEQAFRYGRIHAMIADNPEVEVVDETTGRLLGTARFRRADREGLDRGAGVALALAGKRREVTRVKDDRVYVQSSDGLEASRFIAREAPRYSFGLARDLARHLGLAPDELLLEVGERAATLSHFTGTIFGSLLASVLEERGVKRRAPGAGDAFFVPVDPDAESSLRDGFGTAKSLEAAMRARMAAEARRYASRLQAGPWIECVPDDMVVRWVQGAIDARRLAEFLAGARLRVVSTEPEPEALS